MVIESDQNSILILTAMIIDQSSYSLDLEPKYSVVKTHQKICYHPPVFLLNSEFTLKTSNNMEV